MSTMQKVLVGATLVANCSALHMQSRSPTVVHMNNLDDMSFTSNIHISGQSMPMIMDTGSFEIVAFEEGCAGCPSSTGTYFNRSKAQSNLQITDQQFTQNYGSGSVYCNASFAKVSTAPLKSQSQLFWLANAVELDFELDSAFAGIFGMGPPASALSFAQQDLNWVEEELDGMPQEVVDQYQYVMDDLQAVVDLEVQANTYLGSIATTMFSICLLPGLQQPGKVIFNDEASISDWVNITNTGFWEVNISSIKIGDTPVMSNSSSHCTAIMDSGTSLIGVPQEAYTYIVDRVQALLKKHGNCDDLDDWPMLEFKVGADDHLLSLSPSSYVGKVYYYWDDDSEEGVGVHGSDGPIGGKRVMDHISSGRFSRRETLNRLMPHLNISGHRRSTEMTRSSRQQPTCAALVFLLDDMDPASGCQFLFGLPVFRDYYVSHSLNADSGEGAQMAFSKGTADCTGVESLKAEEHGPALVSTVPLTVKPGKIRFPSRASLKYRNLTHIRSRHVKRY